MSVPPLSLTVETGEGTTRLRLAGVLDYDTSDTFGARASACVDADPAPAELRLDCAGLRLCDSMGLAVLLMIHRRTAARGITLVLDDPPPSMERMLRITGTRHLFARGIESARSPDELSETTD
ncbi:MULTISPECIES: STAS domain-containing protein [unclassified Streptomyces]|uniref:STAS domain-containing protein n=1 Tax=unclassified Streptomyces TaxID=2593676 RepID=UPI0003737298|nr:MULTISPECIES: STAS domain-containing protein [unclassified Streptomyces]MYQ78793.1 STAS domain-containing protein [Streptomyces sp. SID4923]OKJ04962.1 anti-anti-sigma factor [Streptomyces sp. CB01249]